MTEQGFYNSANTPEAEIERLRTFDYPNSVSIELLNRVPDLSNKKFLDAGSGSNVRLKHYVEGRNGLYFPSDRNLKMLETIKAQSEPPFYGTAANIGELPFQDHSFDLSHERFVLMHLEEKDQIEAVKELARITNGRLHLLEYDWNTLSSTNDSTTLDEFRQLSSALMEKAKVDSGMGGKLEQLVRKADPSLQFIVEHFQRPEGNYSKELVDLCKASSQLAVKFSDSTLSKGFIDLSTRLEKASIQFIPPEIVALTIDLQ